MKGWRENKNVIVTKSSFRVKRAFTHCFARIRLFLIFLPDLVDHSLRWKASVKMQQLMSVGL